MLDDTDADDANQGGVAEHVDVEASNEDDDDDGGDGDGDADQGGVAKHGDIKASNWDDPDADADKQGGVAEHVDVEASNGDTARLVATTWGDQPHCQKVFLLIINITGHHSSFFFWGGRGDGQLSSSPCPILTGLEPPTWMEVTTFQRA